MAWIVFHRGEKTKLLIGEHRRRTGQSGFPSAGYSTHRLINVSSNGERACVLTKMQDEKFSDDVPLCPTGRFDEDSGHGRYGNLWRTRSEPQGNKNGQTMAHLVIEFLLTIRLFLNAKYHFFFVTDWGLTLKVCISSCWKLERSVRIE